MTHWCHPAELSGRECRRCGRELTKEVLNAQIDEHERVFGPKTWTRARVLRANKVGGAELDAYLQHDYKIRKALGVLDQMELDYFVPSPEDEGFIEYGLDHDPWELFVYAKRRDTKKRIRAFARDGSVWSRLLEVVERFGKMAKERGYEV